MATKNKEMEMEQFRANVLPKYIKLVNDKLAKEEQIKKNIRLAKEAKLQAIKRIYSKH